MKRECIELLIENNREIEFTYIDKRYSITYYDDKRKKYISFAEFYKTPIDVSSVNELLKIKLDKKTLEEVFAKLPDENIDIF